MRSWDFYSVCLAIAGMLLVFAFGAFAGALFQKSNSEELDHGATAWGYMQQLNVVNTDCHKAPNGYACMVILSSGPARFVLCKGGQCEEILAQ